MSARITPAGRVYQLDRPAQPDEAVTEEDVADRSKLARLLMRVLKNVATVLRRFHPRRIDFEDRDVGESGAILRLTHGFDTRVRWAVVDWVPTVDGTRHALQRHTSTDTKTLALASYAAGVATVRVEEAG